MVPCCSAVAAASGPQPIRRYPVRHVPDRRRDVGDGRDYRLGYGLGVLDRGDLDVELGVDAQHRESPLPGGTDRGARAGDAKDRLTREGRAGRAHVIARPGTG